MGCKHEQQFLRVIEDTMWCRKCGAVSGIAGRLVMFEPTATERASAHRWISPADAEEEDDEEDDEAEVTPKAAP